jgi:hypothetical protein
MRKVMAFIYPVLSSIYSYIFTTEAIYSLSRVYLLTSGSGGADAYTVGIIGGADFSITYMPIVLKSITMLVYAISFYAFSVVNIIFSFRKNRSVRVSWVLFAWVVFNMSFYITLPPQAYVVAFYLFLRRLHISDFQSWPPYFIITTIILMGILTAISIFRDGVNLPPVKYLQEDK